jgi:hypothetical protein
MKTRVNERTVRCDECGFGYVHPIDNRIHAKYHYRYLDAVDKFGPLLFYSERERLKRDAYSILFAKGSLVNERVVAVEKLFHAYFSRSVQGSNFGLKHPPYENYCAMLLNQQHWEEFLKPFPEVYQQLLQKYGRKEGIDEGKTYYPLRG